MKNIPLRIRQSVKSGIIAIVRTANFPRSAGWHARFASPPSDGSPRVPQAGMHRNGDVCSAFTASQNQGGPP